MTFSPRVLLIEDHAQSLDLLRRAFLSAGIESGSLFLAKNKKDALQQLQRTHFHGMSIDQNIPADENGVVISDNGLEFAEPARWPITMRYIYTQKGETAHANRAGLAGVKYREKAEKSDTGVSRTLYDYAGEFVRELEGRYIELALRSASALLPSSLAAPALEAADARNAHNWTAFFRKFTALRERVLKLTLAITYAAESRSHSKPVNLSAGEVEKALMASWSSVPVPYRRYVTTGQTFFDALAALRALRNANEHFDHADYVEDDFQKMSGHIVAVIDLLAFYCEVPIMHNIRFDPTIRGLLTFEKMGPNKVPLTGQWEDHFDPPAPSDESLFMPWQTDRGQKLLNLTPWLTARRTLDRELEIVSTLESKPIIL